MNIWFKVISFKISLSAKYLVVWLICLTANSMIQIFECFIFIQITCNLKGIGWQSQTWVKIRISWESINYPNAQAIHTLVWLNQKLYMKKKKHQCPLSSQSESQVKFKMESREVDRISTKIYFLSSVSSPSSSIYWSFEK